MNITATASEATDTDILAGIRNGTWLDTQTFPPLQYAVDGIVSEGLSIIAGPPKVGKSWFVANIALAVASGGRALGRIPVNQRPVFYLALEDGHRRLQDRFRQIMAGNPLPDGLNYVIKAHSYEVIPMITEFLTRHPGTAPLVILDTFGKIKPRRRPGDDPYQLDYALGTALKDAIENQPGASLSVVHHTRKAESADFVDSVSGTHGIVGAADSVLTLNRKRHQTNGILAVTGRDIQEAEYALTTTDGIWILDGTDLITANAAAQTRREEGQLADRSTEILTIVNNRHTEELVTVAADIAEKIGIDQNQASIYLGRLAKSGRIGKLSRGVYRGA
ncbi:hypothetical protein AU190_15885 [Mycolicibacterium acapulense]|uniref:AAA+ ATPase domain-containing protein n=1 Tax=Mycobacterium lehmannii TaxID=2048550 RepID=A0A117JJ19_9MYCO|nr:AAA family ATPase [Mycobacterium lehmannii]KUI03936.1 hypothetical protein AU190_15885 [Mycolicibacterium acapulense]KUI13242.1 hypothetical protein AU192_18275 [Mycobacterium lehmannii]KUI13540.1 hypothetical protein AU191_10350 [Mycolicibacterium acapulense]